MIMFVSDTALALCKHLDKVSLDLICVVRKPTFWFLTRYDTNQAEQIQKIARGLKFRI